MFEDRPWLKNYPAGVPANIDENKYNSVLDLLNETFAKYPDKIAFECMGKQLSYTQIKTYSTQFGSYLAHLGLKPGDRIALMMPNLLQYPIALFGSMMAGLIVVNTNPLYTPREMKHQFIDSGVKAVLIAENFASHLQEIIGETQIRNVIVTSIGEMLPWPKGSIVNFVVRHIKRLVPKYSIPNVVTFKEALKYGKKFTIPAFESNPEDVVSLQYTGGTTGVAKGAMLTNKNLVANMLQIRSVMMPELNEANENSLCPLPMYHIFAFTVHCLALFSYGIKSILITNARDIPSIIKEWKKQPISLISGVNTLFNALLNNKDFKNLDFSRLKISVAGGMALQRSVGERWLQTTGKLLCEGYGLTETSPVACVNPLNGTARLGAIGLPVPSTEVRIMGEDGTVEPVGGVGEIQIKGPQVTPGYYNRPDETAKVLNDGWFSTGDIGKMDSDGFFYIVDRKKDMILVSGFNVYPNEIEDVISAYPKVLEVAAIGIPDERSGEVVKVFIVKKDKSLTEKEIIAYCKENLTNYKIPKVIEFRSDLPKSNVGKIIRRLLRE